MSFLSGEYLQRAAAAVGAGVQLAKDKAQEKGILSSAEKCSMCTTPAYHPYNGVGKNQCCICSRWVCEEHAKDCLPPRKAVDRYSVPKDFLPERKDPKTMVERLYALGESSTQFVCASECKQRCVERWMKLYDDAMAERMRVKRFLTWLGETGGATDAESLQRHFAYEVPTGDGTTNDSFTKRAWLAGYTVANTGLSLLPLGTYASVAVNTFVYGTQAITIFSYLKGQFGLDDSMYHFIMAIISTLQPKLLELQRIARENGTAPTKGKYANDAYLAAGIFYLSADHKLGRIASQTATGTVLQQGLYGAYVCPDDVMDRLGRSLDKAQWLYSTVIPGVHNTQPWTEWFLGRVLLRCGWTLVGCNLENERLPNYTKQSGIAPCFALAVRSNGSIKEAVLCIRGTKTGADVVIDLDHDPLDFTLLPSPDQSDRPIEGFLHAGMLLAGRCVLENCHAGHMIDELLDQGGFTSLQIVGHSLGAGVAAVIAMLLHNKYSTQVLAKQRTHMPSIETIGFGMPAVACEKIATACAKAGLVTSVVNHMDIVPRMSWHNMSKLAVELGANQTKAAVQLDRDLASYKEYAMSLGAASKREATPSAAGGPVAPNTDLEQVDSLMRDLALSDPPFDAKADSAAGGEAVVPSAAGSTAVASTRQKDPPRLVPPGKIVYMHEIPGGSIEAYVVDHSLPQLSEIHLVSTCVSDHYNKSYFAAIRALKHRRQAAVGSMRVRPPVTLAPLKTATATSADGSTGWTPCHVCGTDTTWPYTLKSSLTRSSGTHHCVACGQVCCSVCAPAGDAIPDDGINKTVATDDLRVPLPLSGHLTPQRVCLPCFFQSYDF